MAQDKGVKDYKITDIDQLLEPGVSAIPERAKIHTDLNPQNVNIPMLLMVFGLPVFGLVVLYSVSGPDAYGLYHDSAHFLKRQIIQTLIGLAAMIAIMFIPIKDVGLVMDIFTNLLQSNYLLVTASCCVGSGLFLLIAVWYTRQHYAAPVRSSKPLSVLRFAIYQTLAYLLPGVSHVALGSTGLMLSDVEPKVIVREMLVYLAPSMFVVNAARIVRYIIGGVVLSPVMIAVAFAGAALGSLLMIHLISKFNLRKHFVFFAVYAVVFGLFIAVSAFVF